MRPYRRMVPQRMIPCAGRPCPQTISMTALVSALPSWSSSIAPDGLRITRKRSSVGKTASGVVDVAKCSNGMEDLNIYSVAKVVIQKYGDGVGLYAAT